jgi:hypothetical protein
MASGTEGFIDDVNAGLLDRMGAVTGYAIGAFPGSLQRFAVTAFLEIF